MKEPFQVLYVDDEEFLLDLARLFLERSGDMVVSVTTSPHEVLDHMESGRYDAIISDYEMPVMNGIELLKAVRERDTTFPFILFTGRGREEVAIEALNNGANFYLQKGGDPKAQFAELAHKVRQAILLNQTGKELHRSHQELSRATNRYKALIAASNTGAWEYHVDTGYTWCSAEYFSMLGRDINAYDHAGAMNVKEVWEDLLHPDDRQKAKETFLAYVNRPVGMYEQYFRMLHIDGHYVWIWSRGRTILDDDGTPTPITVGTHIDITRQKEQEELLQKSHDEIQAAYDVIAKTGEELRASLDRLTIQEQALRESEEKFRTLFESAADGILILEDGKILDCNHQAEVLFRLSKNALIGRSPAELAPPFHPDGVLSHDLCAEKIRTVSAGGPVRFECVHQNSDGREFFAEVTLQQISIQGRAYLQAFIRDISDRKRAEMELIRKNEELATAYEEILSAEAEARESQDELIRKDLILQDTKNRLDDIIAFLPDATFAIDREGMVIAWNRAMEEMTGVMAEDMMGKGNYEYSLPFYNERRPMLIDLALTGDETIADRYPTISRKGSFLYSSEIFLPHFYQGRGGYFWFTSCPFFDHDGNITGAIECIRDITDRKRVEEALEKHLVALTRPLDDPALSFDEIFDIREIQKIQDEFAEAAGVASIITHPDGRPITRPSRFTRLCNDIIRKTELGCKNCYRSDAIIGSPYPDGPVVQPCMSGGLWDAGASIVVGNRHIANWLIGQVRNENQSEEAMREYAREIGADEEDIAAAFRDVPSMSYEQFSTIARFLFTLSKKLSESAYQNVQQARFIVDLGQQNKELCETQKRLREREDFLDSLTRTIPGVVYQFYAQPSGEMGLRYVSTRAEDILGITIDFDTFFDRFTTCVDERDREAFLRSIADAVREEKPWEFEGRFIKPTGEVIWFQGSSIPVREGDFLTFSGIILDITRRKQAEIELLERNREREETFKEAATLSESLREANKKLALLSSITRHDILNRVSVLMGYLDLAADLPAISDELMIYLKKCSSVTSDIARQIEFTRIYQDIGTHDPLWQRLDEMVGNVSIPQDISLVYVPTTVEIYADAMMVKVLENLFENAYRHGGTVTTISISTRKDGDRLVILVEDDGAGIADDEKERIFERGYGKNTGLGLFLAREILAITGISITETGMFGKGARFEIVVPEGRWRV